MYLEPRRQVLAGWGWEEAGVVCSGGADPVWGPEARAARCMLLCESPGCGGVVGMSCFRGALTGGSRESAGSWWFLCVGRDPNRFGVRLWLRGLCRVAMVMVLREQTVGLAGYAGVGGTIFT